MGKKRYGGVLLGGSLSPEAETLLISVRNESGSLIPKGSVVYPEGSTGTLPLIGLADSSDFYKCRLIGVAREDIPNNSNGLVTKFGTQTGVDTSSFSAGDVIYLSDSAPGGLTNIQPQGGSFVSQVGITLDSATDGMIKVDTNTSELSVEVTDTNGYPSDQRAGTTLSFDDATRTFSVAPTGSTFHFYQDGIKYQKTTTQSVVIDDIEGYHAIYFDLGALTSLANPSEGQVDQIIRKKGLTAYVYWNATDSEAVYVADERHGISMPPDTHSYLHFTRGAQYLSGLALNNVVANGSGNVDASAQFGADSGFTTDEDLINVCLSVASTAGLPIYYIDGASVNLRSTAKAGFSVIDDVAAGVGATGRLVYNEFTGTAWQLSTVNNNDFVLCHVFALNDNDSSRRIISIIGQNQYGTIGAARAGAETEISSILTVFPVEELVPIATLIFQTSDGYTNAVQARVRSDGEGNDYTDWRTSELQAGAPSASHNNLANLEKAGTGITWGHVSAGETLNVDSLFADFDVSALTFTDRTPYPKTAFQALAAVFSMKKLPKSQYGDKDHQLDHSKLHPYLDGSGDIPTRDMSASISCINEVVKWLVRIVIALLFMNIAMLWWLL